MREYTKAVIAFDKTNTDIDQAAKLDARGRLCAGNAGGTSSANLNEAGKTCANRSPFERCAAVIFHGLHIRASAKGPPGPR